jgi:hypothetical protein
MPKSALHKMALQTACRSPASRRLIGLASLACVVLANASASAEMKTFRDWTAACDNVRTCSAYGFDADLVSNAYLRIAREGAPDAPLRITVAVNVQDGGKFKLSFDDGSLPGLAAEAVARTTNDDDDYKRLVISDPPAVEAAVASLRKAKKLTVTCIDPPGATPSDPVVTEISLTGLAAALLWIDEQQKRVGSVTAVIGRGDKPAATVPTPPALPVVAAVKLSTAPVPKKPPAAVIAKARAVCEDKTISEAEDATRLGVNEVMYWFQCKDMSGAYNYFYTLLIDTPGKPVRPAEFSLPHELAGKDGGTDTNMNPGLDESTQTLSMFNKGRGFGDCGSTSDWVWDGRAFRMIALKSMPSCQGVASGDWPTLYRAQRK